MIGSASFVFLGGKGGVGKTTCAAARAVAEGLRGRRVLLASSDPAHSLGDALGVRLRGTPSRVAVGRGRWIDAVEIDASRAFARWLNAHRDALSDAIEHGTWLDREDIDALLDLPLPGVDELVGLIELTRLAATRANEVVVVDTAPTGHTLRLIAAPQTVATVAEVLDALQEEHRIIRRQFGRIGRPEAADRVIAEIASEARRIAALLRDAGRAAFEWVMLPETLSLEESADAIRALARMSIRVGGIVVNRIVPDGPLCPICDRRRRDQRQVVARIPRRLGKLPVRFVADRIAEPRGVAALARLGRALSADAPSTLARVAGAARFASSRVRQFPLTGRSIAPESSEAFTGARLLFFGGKGGVGKTTVAAAAAIRLARADAAARVLLISTDPAHSVGDVLGQPVGDVPVPVRGGPRNLRVRELDASAALRSARADLDAAISEIVDTLGRPGVSARPAGASSTTVASRLLDLAPPGIDELFGLLALVRSSADASGGELIVVDTAPTGHALRLLEMPDTAREWVQMLLRVLLKYREIAKPGHLAEELVALSRSIRQLSTLLRDPTSTRFLVVTRAADVARLETERLSARLRTFGLAVPAVVVNALTFAPGACPRCQRSAAAERTALKAIRRSCARRRGCAIIQTPLIAPPPSGAAALERWAGRWIG